MHLTLLQINYALTIKEYGSMNKAAEHLGISQPTLTNAVQELEKELGMQIFLRTHKGAVPTAEGEEFLQNASQLFRQYELVCEKYINKDIKRKFGVSTQHYTFAVDAFINTVKQYDTLEFDLAIRETETLNVIKDVGSLKSEIGILYMNRFNETVIKKTLRDNGLIFEPLFRAKPHVFVGKDSPLAKKKSLSLSDLKPYPRLSYEQGSHNSFYFSEEILSTVDADKELLVHDRATLFNLLIGMHGYTICSGVINEELNGPNIVARPLKVDDYMEIGYILPSTMHPSNLTKAYIAILKELTKNS